MPYLKLFGKMLIKKTLGKFSNNIPYLKLFALAIFAVTLRVRRLFNSFFKKLALFSKKYTFGAVERHL